MKKLMLIIVMLLLVGCAYRCEQCPFTDIVYPITNSRDERGMVLIPKGDLNKENSEIMYMTNVNLITISGIRYVKIPDYHYF